MVWRWLATREVAISTPGRGPLSGNDLGQVVHTRASVTKQYTLVPVAGQRCPATGKVTVGLAYWPRTQGLSKGDEHPPTLLGTHYFYLYNLSALYPVYTIQPVVKPVVQPV